MQTRQLKYAMVWLALAAAFATQSALAEAVRFSNIRFDPGDNWTVAQQAPQMILRSRNNMIATAVRVTIEPAAPFPGTPEEARDTTWASKLAGHATQADPVVTETRDIPGDGLETGIGAAILPAGGVYVAIVKSGDFATRITLTADTDVAYQLGAMFLGPLLMSLEVVQDEPPPSVTGTGGGGSGGSVTFNWNGPGRLDYGIYDHGCLNYDDEFKRLVNANHSLIGSVAPQSVTWDAALATLRARLKEPAMKAGYDAANEAAKGKSGTDSEGSGAALYLTDPEVALGQLLAGVEQSPSDPGRLFNLAGALSQNGMANEALAALARIREIGKLPPLTLGVDAEAALDYQAGYAEMLRGDLAAAKAKFQATISRDRFINEAAQGLALIQAHEGNGAAGKQTYLDGMWRFKPKKIIHCGESRDDVRPPVDDMFDTSMGVEGKLVKFWHPDKATDLAPFFEMAGALATERNAIAEPLKQRMIAMGNNARFAGGTGDPYDAWADKMSQLIEGLDEDEPYVLAVKDDLEEAIAAAEKIAGTNQAFVAQRVIALALTPGNHCPTYRGLITQGIQGVRPHAERVEAAFREYARVWFKIATGLNSNVGDPEWFEYNDVSLRATLESMNAGMLAMIMTYYGFPTDVIVECPEEFVEMFATEGQPSVAGDPCKEMFGNLKFKHTVEMPKGVPGPKFDVEIGCDKINVDGKWDVGSASAGKLGNFALGGRASAEFVKGKGFTLFAGVGSDVKFAGKSGSAQAGAYISGDAAGLTDLGGRTSLNRVDGSKEKMDFSLMPRAQTAPRGPRLKSFYAPP